MVPFYEIIPLKKFRKTNKVSFYNVPIVNDLKAIDLVIHEESAFSPGKVGNVERPWYYHPSQIDNLFVTFGTRIVDLYKIGESDNIITFKVTPNSISQIFYSPDGNIEKENLLIDEPSILKWNTKVFHRVETGKQGSASVNLAAHLDGFDIKTNFNVYSLDIKNQTFEVLRQGFKDQM